MVGCICFSVILVTKITKLNLLFLDENLIRRQFIRGFSRRVKRIWYILADFIVLMEILPTTCQ